MTMIRRFAATHDQPSIIEAKDDDGERVGVMDLLRYEDFEHEFAGIPCAVRTDHTVKERRAYHRAGRGQYRALLLIEE